MSAPASAVPIAIVGAGWAGCAAAVTLARAGFAVTLFEQATTLGGRARRVILDGMALDNGQHLVIGAYRQTLDLMATVHGAAHAAGLFHRLPLTLAPLAAPRPDAILLRAWRAPAPIHLAGALLTARGLSWRERLALSRGYVRIARAGFRCPPAQTVAECLAATPRRAMEAVWSPLCVAALNTPPERASAQVFANVLREVFSARAAYSDFLVPNTDLSALFPDAAARFVTRNGGSVRTGVTVTQVAADAGTVDVRSNSGRERFAAAIVAVGPHQLAATLGSDGTGIDVGPWRAALASVAALRYESITTAYLAYPAAISIPDRIARLDDAPGQWVFDRSAALAPGESQPARSLLAVVISANGPHDALDHATLRGRIDGQLRRHLPTLPPPLWCRVIAERRATYACTPGLSLPGAGRVASGLYLAGDYTDADLPATLEAATRSGVAAAHAVQADLRRDAN